jgi:hypothetical protein
MQLRRLQGLLPGLLGWFTTLGCGGGQSEPGITRSETWFDGNALDPAKTAIPTTLYAGNAKGILAYAVDESSLFIAFSENTDPNGLAGQTISLKSCSLDSCAKTVRTLYRRAVPPDWVFGAFAVADDEIVFTAVDDAGPLIMACPLTGCDTGARTVSAPTEGTGGAFVNVRSMIVADDDLFWISGHLIWRCSRAGGAKPIAKDIPQITRTEEFGVGLDALVVSGEFVYAASRLGVARIKRDWWADPDWFFAGDGREPIQGIAVAGSSVYFGVASMIGGLRRCPLTGCQGGAETVIAESGPWSLAADERALYWISDPNSPSTGYARPSALLTTPLDGSTSPKALATFISQDSHWPLIMNSGHIYWRDSSGERGHPGVGADEELRLRTRAK